METHSHCYVCMCAHACVYTFGFRGQAISDTPCAIVRKLLRTGSDYMEATANFMRCMRVTTRCETRTGAAAWIRCSTFRHNEGWHVAVGRHAASLSHCPTLLCHLHHPSGENMFRRLHSRWCSPSMTNDAAAQ